MNRDEAITLRATPWQDKHLIVSLFTEKEGRVDAIAYGSRSGRSRIRSVYFLPLNLIEVVYANRRPSSGLRQIGECSFVLVPVSDQLSPLKTMYRQLLLEIYGRLIREEYPSPELYGCLRDFVRWFAEADSKLYTGVMWLLWNSSRLSGVGPDETWLSRLLLQIGRSAACSPEQFSGYFSALTACPVSELPANPILGPERMAALRALGEHLLAQFGVKEEIRSLDYFPQALN